MTRVLASFASVFFEKGLLAPLKMVYKCKKFASSSILTFIGYRGLIATLDGPPDREVAQRAK